MSTVKAELNKLRAAHAEDLADLSLAKEVEGVRRRADSGAAMLREATEVDAQALAAASAKLRKAQALEAQVQGYASTSVKSSTEPLASPRRCWPTTRPTAGSTARRWLAGTHSRRRSPSSLPPPPSCALPSPRHSPHYEA